MIDINEKLNNIILKYELDKYYPRFRKKLSGEKLLAEWAGKLPDKRILCVGADQEDINYFSHLFYNCGKEFSYRLFSEEMQDTEDYQEIIVISRLENRKIAHWCKHHEKQVTFIYDILEMNRIYCDSDLYRIIDFDNNSELENNFPGKRGWREASLMEFYTQKEKLACLENMEYRHQCAGKLFFLSLYIKNFIQAEKYQKILTGMGDLLPAKAWGEITLLLIDIKRRLHDRKQADIVMVWMDAVSYGTGDDMPFLQRQIKEGISFRNAFTVTPYTNATAQTLFLEKKLLDDALYLEKEISEERSPILIELRKRGYTVKIISGYLSIFERKLMSCNYHELYTPCSAIFWDILCNLFAFEEPMFILAHCLIESHAPHLTTFMENTDVLNWPLRMHKGHMELDQQMEYYMGFLGEETTRIFMSDHGQPNVREQFHTYFIINSKMISHRSAEELFSYVDFSKLLRHILDGGTLEKPLFDRKYAEVQMLDRYNFNVVGDIIQKKDLVRIEYFGYFGIITKEYLYLKYHIGKEFLTRWDSFQGEPHLLYRAHDICDDSLLPHFRELVGNRSIDVNANEKFKYTRFLYKVYRNFVRRYNEVFDEVNGLFCNYPEYSVALRMGGEHSMELFYILTASQKKKIGYIVDQNADCRCRSLGIPVISLQDLTPGKVKAVVLSSFDYIEELRAEAKCYPKDIDVIDLYKSLEARGILCDNNFYAVNYMKDKDYDVGFPFK